jgi:hypothetical protein
MGTIVIVANRGGTMIYERISPLLLQYQLWA